MKIEVYIESCLKIMVKFTKHGFQNGNRQAWCNILLLVEAFLGAGVLA